MKYQIAIIGLGYVGLPLAIEFGKILDVFGYDKDNLRIKQLKKSNDTNNDISSKEFHKSKYLKFTNNLNQIKDCNFYIITVPTPIDRNKIPDLFYIKQACLEVASVIKKNDIVVFESTVYPGLTEEFCMPLIEKNSNLKFNKDFFCGYSPERINPNDKKHTITKITKITSGSNKKSANIIDNLYKKIIKAGTYKVSSIKVAEAAKVIENSQRDLNIAFMNELSQIFHLLNINTNEVLEAASTKWNFLNFSPGLVGGHCIGVDPYYLTYKAESVGYYPQVILSGRRINDGMGKFVAEQVVKMLIQADKPVRNARIGILGITFKENVADIRNSKVIDVINELQTYNTDVIVTDPYASSEDVKHEYGLELLPFENINNLDALIIAVPHNAYREMSADRMFSLFNGGEKVVFDIKGIFRHNLSIVKTGKYQYL